MALELLLAHADDGRPVLPRGIAEETLLGVPPPPPGEAPLDLGQGSGGTSYDPNVLGGQGWAIVAPAGPRGDRLLALIEPLKQARAQAQGGHVTVYRVPRAKQVDGAWAMRWKREVFRQEGRPELALPRYLLLLGDLDELPLEVQQVLSTDCYVGRLAFPADAGDAGYEAYVAKVLRWEGMAPHEPRSRMLFYTSWDKAGRAQELEAIEAGYGGLVAPNIAACRRGQPLGDFPPADILELGSSEQPALLDQLLAQASQPVPGVLFSLSHGAAASGAAQRQRQGALILPQGRLLLGTDIASGPFLPGGVWFCFACFSAGTPARSSYGLWLHQLAASNPQAAQSLASALLPDGARPFISALPQAALANPDGPLAVIGHVDLAWSYAYDDVRPAPSRFFGVLKRLAEGSRVGFALSALLQFVNETSVELTLLYQQGQQGASGAQPLIANPRKWAELWMARQDLSNYLLLGDPAVQLPLLPSGQELPGMADEVLVVADSPAASSPVAAEAVILELLSGRRSLEDIALRNALSPSELREWENLYRAAGREALARHLSKNP